MPISGAKAVEYVEEVTYGTTPLNPTMVWIGLVNSFSPCIAKEYEEAKYQGAYDATDMLQKMRNMQVSGELTASMTYKPQDWTFLQYITGSATGLFDTVCSISVAQFTDNQWIVYEGGMLTKWELTLPKEGIATVDVDIGFGDMRYPTLGPICGTTIELVVADGTSEKEEKLAASQLCANMLLTDIYFEVPQLTAGQTAKLELYTERDNTIYSTGDLDASSATDYPIHNLSRGLMGETTFKVICDANVTDNKTFNVEIMGIQSRRADFIGTGSHASEAAGDPFMWEDTTNITLNGVSIMHCLGELKLGITNEVEFPKDLGSSMWARAEGAVVTKRELFVSLELTWTDLSFFNLVKAGTKQTLSFTLGNKIITVAGLIFPEVGYEITPDNFIGETVTAITNQPNLTIADI